MHCSEPCSKQLKGMPPSHAREPQRPGCRRREPRNSTPFKTIHLTVNLNGALRITISPVMLALRVHLPNFSTKSRRKIGALVHSYGELQGSRRLRFPLRPLALISPKSRRNQGTREASATSWPDALPYFFALNPAKKQGPAASGKARSPTQIARGRNCFFSLCEHRRVFRPAGRFNAG